MNEIGDKYLIFNQTVPVKNKKIETPKQLPSAMEVWEKGATNMLGFYQGKDAVFTPVLDEKSSVAKERVMSSQEPEPKEIQKKATSVEGKEISKTEADAFISEKRTGKLLTKDNILKPDHHPQLLGEAEKTREKAKIQIPGAPNYRNVNGVRGTSQPTVDGIRGVLDDAGEKGKKIKWVNLREEPVVYINGKPLSLRKLKTPFKNLENPGVKANDIEKQEKELKKEILEEAKRNGGKLIIHDEDEKGNLVPKEVVIGENSVKTTEEVFNDFKKEGYKVDFKRLPVTDEKAPEKKDFDDLTKALKDDSPDTPVIFNCHAGRGRTTTGMVIADLMNHAKEDRFNKSITRNKTVRKEIIEQGDNVDPKAKAGELRRILSLVKTLEEFTSGKNKDPKEADRAIDELSAILQDREPGKTSGPSENKAKTDDAIERTSQVQNLKESTIKELAKVRYGSPSEKQKAMNYMKRYFLLLSYQEYLKDEAKGGFKTSFSDWFETHGEFKTMLDRVQIALLGSSGNTAFA